MNRISDQLQRTIESAQALRQAAQRGDFPPAHQLEPQFRPGFIEVQVETEFYTALVLGQIEAGQLATASLCGRVNHEGFVCTQSAGSSCPDCGRTLHG